MATKEKSTTTDIVLAAGIDRYTSLNHESDDSRSLRTSLEERENHLRVLKKEVSELRSKLTRKLIEGSGLSIGDVVLHRRQGEVQIVDFFLNYDPVVDREILHFHYSKINKDGSVNRREKSRYNQASVIDIASEGA